MDNEFPVFAPLGRLYEPLLQLAGRVRRTLVNSNKTVWTDKNGYVFATPTDHLRAIKPHTIVGVYAKWSTLSAIETGLRLALRERASRWIVDWKIQPLGTRTDSRALRLAISRKRRRNDSNGSAVATPHSLDRASQLHSRS